MIPLDLIDRMVAHARAEHPIEACGVLAGPAGSTQPNRFIPMTNADASAEIFRFDSAEQLRVWRDMEVRGEEPVVVYHSHSSTAAFPSSTDVALATMPQVHYVVISTCDTDAIDVRSFRILDGVVEEEPVHPSDTELRRSAHDVDNRVDPDHPA